MDRAAFAKTHQRQLKLVRNGLLSDPENAVDVLYLNRGTAADPRYFCARGDNKLEGFWAKLREVRYVAWRSCCCR